MHHRVKQRRNFEFTVIPSIVKLGSTDREAFYDSPKRCASNSIGCGKYNW